MRYRDNKVFYKGGIYHIYDRGVAKLPTFLDEWDFENFFKRVALVLGTTPVSTRRTKGLQIKPLLPNSFSILSYCLLDNHFHFVVRQNGEIGIDKLMAKVGTSYSMYFNKKYERVGNLFQRPFRAKLVIDDAYLMTLLLYVHRNPYNPFEYQYSSWQEVVGNINRRICDVEALLLYFDGSLDKYRNYLINTNLFEEDQDELSFS